MSVFRLIACLLALSLAASTAAAFDRAAEAIVADLARARRAVAEAQRSAGPGSEAHRAAAQSLCDLVEELEKADPANRELESWRPERWMALSRLLGKARDADAEINTLLAKLGEGDAARLPRYWLVRVRMETARGFAAEDLKALEAAFDEFIAHHPKAPEAGDLFYEYASFRSDDPDTEINLLSRFVKEYPEHKSARIAAARLERMKSIGRDFELEFDDAISGKKIAMTNLRGKVVVVDFWASWCGPCMAEMPRMKELYAKYKDQGVEFIGVSLDRSQSEGGLDALKAAVKRVGMTWPQYYQGDYWSSKFSNGWGVRSIPAVFVVDANGKLASLDARGRLESILPPLIAKAKSTK